MTLYPVHNWLSPSHRPSVTIFDRQAHLFTGWERGRVWDGFQLPDHATGIDGPPAGWLPTTNVVTAGVVGGGATAGTHRVRYRYFDDSDGNYSPPTDPFVIVVTDSVNVDGSWTWAQGGAGFIEASADSRVSHVLVEVTSVTTGLFYEAARVPNDGTTAAVYDLPDIVLQEFDVLFPVEVGTTHLPLFRYGVAFRRRIFGSGQVVHVDGSVTVTQGSATVTGVGTNWNSSGDADHFWFNAGAEHAILSIDSATSLTLKVAWSLPTASVQGYKIYNRQNLLFWSEADLPEVFDPSNSFEALDKESVVGLAVFSADLLIFGLTTFERFTYNVLPQQGIKRPVPGERGALSHLSILSVDNVVYVMDRQGVYVYTGDTPVPISRPIDRYLENNIDYALRDKFFAVYYPRGRVIRWYIVTVGNSEPHHYIEYDLARKLWCIGKLDVAMTAGETARATVSVQPYVGDENGFSWLDDIGASAGGSNAPARLTVLAGATATSVPIEPGQLTVNDNLQGVAVRTDDNRTAVVASNNTATLELLGAGFTQPPVEGEELLVGRLVCQLKTRAHFMDDSFMTRKRGVYLWLYFEPQAEGEFRVRLFRDLATDPVTYSGAIRAAAGRLLEEGVEAPEEGGTDFVVSLTKSDGVVKIPVGSEPWRVVQAEVLVIEPRSKVVLFGYEFTSAQGKEVRA